MRQGIIRVKRFVHPAIYCMTKSEVRDGRVDRIIVRELLSHSDNDPGHDPYENATAHHSPSMNYIPKPLGSLFELETTG
jgi:hypothetical protein